MVVMNFLESAFPKIKRFVVILILTMAANDLLGADQEVAGAQRRYSASFNQISNAISMAFGNGRFHSAMLISSPNHYDTMRRRCTEKLATNEWNLTADELPLMLVLMGKKSLPYFAQFEISVTPISSNRCDVLITTISCYVRDGREIGVHGGWAWHAKRIAPLHSEETNVLAEIGSALTHLQSGKSNSLSSTPDTKTSAQYEIQQFKDLNPKAEKDLRERLKTHAQSNAPPTGK